MKTTPAKKNSAQPKRSPSRKAKSAMALAPKKQPRRPRSSEEKKDIRQKHFPIVGVGASAGGLEAFSQLLKHLPADTGMAFVLVQHLDPKHGSMLSEILGRSTKMAVVQVQDGMPVEPNRVYVIPPNS